MRDEIDNKCSADEMDSGRCATKMMVNGVVIRSDTKPKMPLQELYRLEFDGCKYGPVKGTG